MTTAADIRHSATDVLRASMDLTGTVNFQTTGHVDDYIRLLYLPTFDYKTTLQTLLTHLDAKNFPPHYVLYDPLFSTMIDNFDMFHEFKEATEIIVDIETLYDHISRLLIEANLRHTQLGDALCLTLTYLARWQHFDELLTYFEDIKAQDVLNEIAMMLQAVKTYITPGQELTV